MKARTLCRTVLALVPLGAMLATQAMAADSVKLLLQSSPLAGFRYHEASGHWQDFRVGDELRLTREPDNAHDANAIRVEWRGRMLGYVPRKENATLAWALDQGQRLHARISALRDEPNPRRRIEFEVFVE